MATTTELRSILRPHWEAHQRDSKALSIASRVHRIQKDVNEHALAVGLHGVSLNDNNNNNKDSVLQEQLAQVLMEFLDGSVALVVQTEDASADAVQAVLELTAAVAATNVAVCRALLQRALQLSEIAHVDLVRVVACKAIGWMVYYIFQQSQTTTPFHDVLDAASQALLPRFTDKTQSVRLAAIQAARHFFVSDTATDPDLLQALLWSLQHDPSVANREAAALSLPVTLETIDFLAQRVRDTKVRVRVAALRALQQNCHDLSLLEPGQCAAIVQAGYTNRYAMLL